MFGDQLLGARRIQKLVEIHNRKEGTESVHGSLLVQSQNENRYEISKKKGEKEREMYDKVRGERRKENKNKR